MFNLQSKTNDCQEIHIRFSYINSNGIFNFWNISNIDISISSTGDFIFDDFKN